MDCGMWSPAEIGCVRRDDIEFVLKAPTVELIPGRCFFKIVIGLLAEVGPSNISVPGTEQDNKTYKCLGWRTFTYM